MSPGVSPAGQHSPPLPHPPGSRSSRSSRSQVLPVPTCGVPQVRFPMLSRHGCGTPEPVPAERAGPGKPSLVLRRRLGCVSPFRGIKQVSPFGGTGSPPCRLSSAFLAFSSECHGPQPCGPLAQPGAAPQLSAHGISPRGKRCRDLAPRQGSRAPSAARVPLWYPDSIRDRGCN